MRGTVYRLSHADVDGAYIGSTRTSLAQRLSSHRMAANKGGSSRLYTAMRDAGLRGWRIEPIEEVDCSSVDGLRLRERHWFDAERPALNTYTPILSPDEVRSRNNEQHRRRYGTDAYREYQRARYAASRARPTCSASRGGMALPICL